MPNYCAYVAVDTVYEIDGEYRYQIPDNLGSLCIGDAVTVPFGRGDLPSHGLVLDIKQENTDGLKSVYHSDSFSVGKEGVDLVKFIKSRYFCTYMDAFRLLTPVNLEENIAPVYDKYYFLNDRKYSETLLMQNGAVRKSCEKQFYVTELLAQSEMSADEILLKGVSRSTLKTLENKNVIGVVMKQKRRNPLSFMSRECVPSEGNNLNEQQKQAYREISAKLNSGSAHLLYGVTGSGKTHVFMALMDDVLSAGKSCMLLLPEISLTFQIIRRLYGRYGDKLAVLHSGLSKGEKRDEWQRIADGEANVLVGTRSAVFAPMQNLGLIIIDEEQEHTYKSEKTPKYNAKDVALYRMHKRNGLLLLASATPSFENYFRGKEGIIGLSILTQRYNRQPLPKVVTVDLRNEAAAGNKNLISRFLAKEIEENLKNKEQTILFINRRGYAGFVQCIGCSAVRKCPHCGIPLAYHKADRKLRCHYCNYSENFGTVCPDCGALLRYSGAGTQKAEEQLSLLFPEAKIARMDADSVCAKPNRERILKAFGNGEYDILLGTQMITKGLDFPDVTLVGVLNADSLLYSSDFRAYEKTFSLLTQVTGRAGRSGKVGRAVIQTFSPSHEVLKYAYDQDYEGFYANQILIRRALLYPPFSDLCQMVFIADTEAAATDTAYSFIDRLRNLMETDEYDDVPITVIKPTVTAVPMVDGRIRVRTIIKCRDKAKTRRLFDTVYTAMLKDSKYKNIQITADMNPQNIL